MAEAAIPSLTPPLLLAVALAAGGVLLLLARLWQRRQRWALARERALAERFRSERDDALRALAQASQAQAAAERSAAAQARWLATASHDLRQPAHALGLYLGALQALPVARSDAELAELAERMRGSLAALEALLAGALDVSRIDAGAVVPQWDTVALAPLLRRLADESALPAEARGLRLSLHMAPNPDGGDALTVTDPQLLERLLRNLLANAVKYTRDGGVLVACRLRRSESGQRLWRIEVWDSGVGIAEADQERVFEEFEQLGSSPGQAQGQGLGLAIVRRLATLLQVRVVLRSRPGRGSVFFVEGLVPAGHAPRAVVAQRLAERSLLSLRVAVLDDDAAVRDATLRLLARWGVQAQDALVSPVPPDALVADLRLRGAHAAGDDGPATVARLQQAWGGRRPVLWVSAEPLSSALRAQLPPGAVVEAKPLSPARLRAWLETLAPET
jgi:signal transduction histidine kinase/CheY-like chemotaxis protein